MDSRSIQECDLDVFYNLPVSSECAQSRPLSRDTSILQSERTIHIARCGALLDICCASRRVAACILMTFVLFVVLRRCCLLQLELPALVNRIHLRTVHRFQDDIPSRLPSSTPCSGAGSLDASTSAAAAGCAEAEEAISVPTDSGIIQSDEIRTTSRQQKPKFPVKRETKARVRSRNKVRIYTSNSLNTAKHHSRHDPIPLWYVYHSCCSTV